MTTTRKLTARQQKKHNRSLILSAIYAYQPISRVNIARLTGLSRPTVTDLTQDLLERALIEQIGAEVKDGKAGKRAALLAINPDAYHLIALELNSARCTGALLSLTGDILYRHTIPYDQTTLPLPFEPVLALMDALMDRVTRPVLGIGVGVPGLLDVQQGVILEASNLGWRDLPLQAMLNERYHLPVYTGNDCNMAALGEYHFGRQATSDHLVALMLGMGIGAGVIVNGQIVSGTGFAAGEIGHMPINGVAALCNCGQRGCLESVSSGWSLLRAANQIAGKQPDSMLGQLADGTTLTLAQVAETAGQGDALTLDLLRQAGHYLGMVLANIICLLNPGEIVLGGELMVFWKWLAPAIHQAIEANVMPQLSQQTCIRQATLGSDWIMLGAAARVLDAELNVWLV
jgi:glucokinase-like ROK family protein